MFANGSIAHLEERIVRNDEVASSSLVGSTRLNKSVVVQSHLFKIGQNDLSKQVLARGLLLCVSNSKPPRANEASHN